LLISNHPLLNSALRLCNFPTYACNLDSYACNLPLYACNFNLYACNVDNYACKFDLYACNFPLYPCKFDLCVCDFGLYACNFPTYACNVDNYACTRPLPLRRACLPGLKDYICSPDRPMLFFRSSFLSRLRFSFVLLSVLLVLGLNQRAVSVLRLPAGKGQPRLTTPAKATVVKQKVMLEATASLEHFVAPLADAWLPAPTTTSTWLPALRRALRVPRPCAGVRAGEVFLARLLAVALSPQAP
jgi:hypothetical protein